MAQKVRSCGIITLGAVIYALAFDWFVAPNQIAMGGVTGLAQIVNALVPVLPVGVLSILVNVPLFLAGWRLLGGRLLVSSLYAMAVSSLAIDVIAWMHTFPPMDPILATLYGGAGMGGGLGLVFSQGATTGGTDILGKLLKLKFPWLPIGKLVMIPDMVVVILAAVVFGTVNAALYGLIQMYLLSKVMDMILYGWDTSRVAYIITDRWEETVQGLLDMNRGVTLLQGKGAYTGAEKQVLLVAFRQREIVPIKRMLREIDPKAFFIVCDAHEILGEGFGDYQKEDRTHLCGGGGGRGLPGRRHRRQDRGLRRLRHPGRSGGVRQAGGPQHRHLALEAGGERRPEGGHADPGVPVLCQWPGGVGGDRQHRRHRQPGVRYAVRP